MTKKRTDHPIKPYASLDTFKRAFECNVRAVVKNSSMSRGLKIFQVTEVVFVYMTDWNVTIDGSACPDERAHDVAFMVNEIMSAHGDQRALHLLMDEEEVAQRAANAIEEAESR